MALTAICLAIAAKLRDVAGVDSVPDQPPAQLANQRMLLVYPNTGQTQPMNNEVIAGRDTIVVEWHLKNPDDKLAYGIQQALPVLDATRLALWSAYRAGEFRTPGVTLLHTVTTETFGQMGWGDDPTFGFRLTLDVSHGFALT